MRGSSDDIKDVRVMRDHIRWTHRPLQSQLHVSFSGSNSKTKSESSTVVTRFVLRQGHSDTVTHVVKPPHA